MLAKGLRTRGCSVVIGVLYEGGPWEDELRAAGVTIRRLEKRGRWDVLGFMVRLIRLVWQEQPNIIHGYLTGNILASVAKVFAPNTRIVWSVRASHIDLTFYDWFYRWVYRLEGRLSHSADLIIANSHVGRDVAIRRGFPKEKTIVVPNGIDTDRFFPRPDERDRMRSKWGIADNQRLIGLVARLDPIKDHATFLQAASEIAKYRSDVRFVCVGGDGTDQYTRSLLTLAGELGVSSLVVWAGEIEDMPAVYSALDVLTLCSIGEGFPNVVAEGMSCGVPCVVSDVGDARYIVKDLGHVIPVRDPQALCNAWHSILDQPPHTRGVQSQELRQRIVEEFSPKRMVDATLVSLKRILQKG